MPRDAGGVKVFGLVAVRNVQDNIGLFLQVCRRSAVTAAAAAAAAVVVGERFRFAVVGKFHWLLSRVVRA